MTVTHAPRPETQNGGRPGLIAAMRHLQERVRVVTASESRHRPHWTEADIEAVLRLLERPAVTEQIALARIEGIARTAQSSIHYRSDAMGDVLMVSRKGLGL